jgi:hypothetical protein
VKWWSCAKRVSLGECLGRAGGLCAA